MLCYSKMIFVRICMHTNAIAHMCIYKYRYVHIHILRYFLRKRYNDTLIHRRNSWTNILLRTYEIQISWIGYLMFKKLFGGIKRRHIKPQVFQWVRMSCWFPTSTKKVDPAERKFLFPKTGSRSHSTCKVFQDASKTSNKQTNKQTCWYT